MVPFSGPPPPERKAREGLHTLLLPHTTFLFPQARQARQRPWGPSRQGPVPQSLSPSPLTLTSPGRCCAAADLRRIGHLVIVSIFPARDSVQRWIWTDDSCKPHETLPRQSPVFLPGSACATSVLCLSLAQPPASSVQVQVQVQVQRPSRPCLPFAVLPSTYQPAWMLHSSREDGPNTTNPSCRLAAMWTPPTQTLAPVSEYDTLYVVARPAHRSTAQNSIGVESITAGPSQHQKAWACRV